MHWQGRFKPAYFGSLSTIVMIYYTTKRLCSFFQLCTSFLYIFIFNRPHTKIQMQTRTAKKFYCTLAHWMHIWHWNWPNFTMRNVWCNDEYDSFIVSKRKRKKNDFFLYSFAEQRHNDIYLLEKQDIRQYAFIRFPGFLTFAMIFFPESLKLRSRGK